MVTYTKEGSRYVNEFKVPFDQVGLKGIITDSEGNAWFYHSTNRTSTIMKFDLSTNEFTSFNIEGETRADDPVIDLAGGQLAYDKTRNAVWFSDARTNSIGKLNLTSEKIDLAPIATPNSGPMGIAMSPDGSSLWFCEVIGDRIASLDPESMHITEYITGEDTGPTFLAFDSSGIIWVSLSYSNSILRAEPGSVIEGSGAGMSTYSLPRPDSFSPFGLAITRAVDEEKIFVSDHGSSRVVSSAINSEFANYISYWTSPSQIFPSTLPSQIVKDSNGDIYFPQHGGNRISKIDVKSGVMTEYDIPTGPLSTAVFIAVSEDAEKIWFTEWASNKIGFVDNSLLIPFDLQVSSDPLTISENGETALKATVEPEGKDAANEQVILPEVEFAVIGMTDSGLQGVTYTAEPQRFDLGSNPVESNIILKTNRDAQRGEYTLVVRASAFEKNGETQISRLYPLQMVLDVPESPIPGQQNSEEGSIEYTQFAIRVLALSSAAGLGGYIIYRKIKKSKPKEK